MWQPTFNRPFSTGIFVGLVGVTSSNYFIGQPSPWESWVSGAKPQGYKNERKAHFYKGEASLCFCCSSICPSAVPNFSFGGWERNPESVKGKKPQVWWELLGRRPARGKALKFGSGLTCISQPQDSWQGKAPLDARSKGNSHFPSKCKENETIWSYVSVCDKSQHCGSNWFNLGPGIELLERNWKSCLVFFSIHNH